MSFDPASPVVALARHAYREAQALAVNAPMRADVLARHVDTLRADARQAVILRPGATSTEQTALDAMLVSGQALVNAYFTLVEATSERITETENTIRKRVWREYSAAQLATIRTQAEGIVTALSPLTTA